MTSESFAQHSERRERLIESLSQKVALVRSFMTQVLTLNTEDPVEKIDKLWENVVEALPAKDRDLYAEWKLAQSTFEESRRELLSSQPEDVEKWSERKETSSHRMSELSAQDERSVIFFLEVMQRLVSNLKRKKMMVQSIVPPEKSRDDSMDLCFEFLQKRLPNLEREDIISLTQEDAFTLVIKMTPEGFEKRTTTEGAGGLFILDTPFCLIRSDVDNYDALVRHERLHAFTDAILPVAHPLEELRLTFFVLQEEMTSEDAVSSDDAFVTFDKKFIDSLIDALHGEMVSAIEHTMEKDFFDPLRKQKKRFAQKVQLPKDIGEASFHKVSSLNRYLNAFNTAGRQMNEMLDFLTNVEKNHTTPSSIVRWSGVLKERLEVAFVDMGEFLEDTSDMIDTLPPFLQEDAEEEMLVLMCLLPPSKYRHLPTYMNAWSKKRLQAQEIA